MESIYRKIFKFDTFVAMNISLIFLYVISGAIGFIAYSKGVIDVGEVGTLTFEVKKVYEIILVVFSLIYSLLVNLAPFLITWWIYVEYNNIFSSLPKLINNVPQSNKSKLKKIIFISLAMFVIYCVVTFLVSYFIDNGKSAVEIIEGLIFKMGTFISPVLSVIIVDMWSRESHIDKGAKSMWNVITLIASIISINLILAIFIEAAPIIFWGFLLVGIIVKIFYIFKNIENIKID